VTKILYFGGQKSGKSKLAELKTLELAQSSQIQNKPYYIATYNDSYDDKEMAVRISNHQTQRTNQFHTIEEQFNLPKVMKKNETYIIDCISMWILNNLETSEDKLEEQLNKLSSLNANIVFVLNDVNSGVIPMDKTSRKFVDLTGIIGQKLASFCNEVYEVKFGIEVQIK